MWQYIMVRAINDAFSSTCPCSHKNDAKREECENLLETSDNNDNVSYFGDAIA